MNHVQTVKGLLEHLNQIQIQLQDYFNLNLDLFCVLQKDGTIQLLSSACSQVMGWSIQDGARRNWFEQIHPEDEPMSRMQLQALEAMNLTERPHCCFVNRMRCAEEGYRDLLWQIVLGSDQLLYATAQVIPPSEPIQADSQPVPDATPLQRVTQVLQTHQSLYESLIEVLPHCLYRKDRQGRLTFANQAFLNWLGASLQDCLGKTAYDYCPKELADQYTADDRRVLEMGETLDLIEQYQRLGAESPQYLQVVKAPVFDARGQIIGTQGIFWDITDRQWAIERDHLMGAIAQRIRQSLNIEEILGTTVAEVRRFLQTDRVILYRFLPDWSGTVVVESVCPEYLPLISQTISDECFQNNWVQSYRHGRVSHINNVQTDPIHPCHRDLLLSLQVQANLVVPILQGKTLWGLLIAHHCSEPRQWQQMEVSLLTQLAAQVAIAIQQSELYQQVQQLNASLEKQIQERTQQLQQAYEFEATLKRITDKVRDSLDEDQILQTAVNELAQGLEVDSCDTALYDLEQGISIIRFEFIRSTASGITAACGTQIAMADYPKVYEQLLHGQPVHYCARRLPENRKRSVRGTEDRFTALACPLSDDQRVLGDLWLYKSREKYFTEQEIRLVQQVANQCAITVRQARLYQASQAQVDQLERLNRLKDDFLSTVSHELRTPISNIMMSVQAMESLLLQMTGDAPARQPWTEPKETKPDEAASIPDAFVAEAQRYLRVLQDESRREIALINDLLDLSRLDANVEPLLLTTIAPQFWIRHITEPFIERFKSQQQQLIFDIPAHLPELTTDLADLERILTELLNNACKYTPAGETITITAKLVSGMRSDRVAASGQPFLSSGDRPVRENSEQSALLITVSNSGVEVPSSECDRIFDKFYRIPNNDPWKHGGTGLGLALVKKLAERLGATIRAESSVRSLTFILKLPLSR